MAKEERRRKERKDEKIKKKKKDGLAGKIRGKKEDSDKKKSYVQLIQCSTYMIIFCHLMTL